MLNSNNLKVSIFITVRLSFGSQIAKKKKKEFGQKDCSLCHSKYLLSI